MVISRALFAFRPLCILLNVCCSIPTTTTLLCFGLFVSFHSIALSIYFIFVVVIVIVVDVGVVVVVVVFCAISSAHIYADAVAVALRFCCLFHYNIFFAYLFIFRVPYLYITMRDVSVCRCMGARVYLWCVVYILLPTYLSFRYAYQRSREPNKRSANFCSFAVLNIFAHCCVWILFFLRFLFLFFFFI